MPRRVRLVIVCEDILQETFIRSFLYRRGIHRRDLTFVTRDPGGGDAKQRLCDELCRQLTGLRRFPGENRGLVFMVDADNLSVEQRLRRMDEACRSNGVEPPRRDEAVFGLVPKWEIENWLAYLRDGAVDEDLNSYDKYSHRVSEIHPLVRELADRCDRQSLPAAPPSLEAACVTYRRFCERLAGS